MTHRLEPRTERELWIEMSILEVAFQARLADVAYANIDWKATNGIDLVFSSIHSFLSHCAVISKMLKAVDDSAPPTSIGEVLGVLVESVIHDRNARNNLDHYDERLRHWIQAHGARSTVALHNIGLKSAIQDPGVIFVKQFDPRSMTFTFVNEDFDLAAMHLEAQRIGSLAAAWSEGAA